MALSAVEPNVVLLELPVVELVAIVVLQPHTIKTREDRNPSGNLPVCLPCESGPSDRLEQPIPFQVPDIQSPMLVRGAPDRMRIFVPRPIEIMAIFPCEFLKVPSQPQTFTSLKRGSKLKYSPIEEPP